MTVAALNYTHTKLWYGVSAVFSLFDPYVRPVIRAFVVDWLRRLLMTLPRILSAIAFDIHSIHIHRDGDPNLEFTVEEIQVHTSLEFTSVEKLPKPEPKRTTSRSFRRSYSMAAWRSRFVGSIKRTWERVAEEKEAQTNISLRLVDIAGIFPSVTSAPVKFLRLPGSIAIDSNMSFDLKRRTFKTHGLNTDIKITNCFVELTPIYDVLKSIKNDTTDPSDEDLNVPGPKTPSFLYIPSSPASPLSARTPDSVYSPSTPRSPFLETLSASLLPRRHHYRPCMKLKDTQRKATLSFLNSIRVQFSSVSFVIRPNQESVPPATHAAVVSNVVLTAGLSDPQKNNLHSSWLGRNNHTEAFDSDIYSMSLTIESLSVTRHSSGLDRIGILMLKRFSWQMLAIQWPSPFLVTSPFIGGDPNSPAVIVRLSISSLDVTESADSLMKYASRSPESVSAEERQNLNNILPLPRFMLEVECGSVSATLLTVAGPGMPLRVLEAKTDGFVLTSRSNFTTISGRFHPVGEFFDEVRLKMTITSALHLKSTFIRARQLHASTHPRITTFAEDPSIVSLEMVDISSHTSLLATIRDDTQNTACVDLSTMESKITCFTDTVCVELWHPLVSDLIRQILEFIPPSLPSHAASTRRFYGAFDASIQRIVLFITAPDIQPDDDSDLSRGFAVYITGPLLQHRALASHDSDEANSRYWENRSKLHLSQDPDVHAFPHAKAVGSAGSPSFSQLTIPNVAVRSAVATRYSPDDPLFAGRDDLNHLDSLGFLQISGIRVIVLQHNHTSDVNVTVSSIRIAFMLGHLYHFLLASQFMKRLLEISPKTNRTYPSLPSRRSYILAASVETTHIHLSLCDEQVVCRFDLLRIDHGPRVPLEIRWDRSMAWVRLPAAIDPWEKERGHQWEQLLAMHKWYVYVPLGQKQSPITVSGDSARIRIPYGFILADLIRDANVAMKACKHLYRMTALGTHIPFPEPDVEGPKDVPRINIQIGFLCAEAADAPLESKLTLIFRSGPDAAASRTDRENAFAVKVDSILNSDDGPADREVPWQFSAKHSVSIQEARSRLDRVHVLDWIMRLDAIRGYQYGAEKEVHQRFKTLSGAYPLTKIPNLVDVLPVSDTPPLFRAAISNLTLSLDKPSFPLERLSDFLHTQGHLPKDTEYWLLIPAHINISLSELKITLRDYPLALAHITSPSDSGEPALVFETDLVIAEEMGPPSSVDWIDCPILTGEGILGEKALTVSVPKTIMPVKTYANPEVRVLTPDISSFSWGVSYAPATHDLMRVVETLTTAPKDPSQPVGFWDKMRLILHWSLRASFKGEVRYHMKGIEITLLAYMKVNSDIISGLRDPYDISDKGAGFVLSWQGHTKLLVGLKNESKELIQVISDSMYISIPELRLFPSQQSAPFKKICAKFSSGVRFGVGFVFERACGPTCTSCQGTSFRRICRYFDFKPHYEVKLEKKEFIPSFNGPADSYAGFRSDFIHLSISLTSSIRSLKKEEPLASSLHLTPKAFSYFYSWWELFNSVLSLPIRLGTYYSPRHISPKFGRHLATLKYRIAVPKLHVMHGYIDDSKETWNDGVTPWLGVKAMIDELEADLHQRDEEIIVADTDGTAMKCTRRKPFYAAELVLKGLDLRAILATFSEPLKMDVDITSPPRKSNYRTGSDLPTTDHTSPWHDSDDYVEIDWSLPQQPGTSIFHVLPVASCPRFAYSKRNSGFSKDGAQRSKFGNEDTHQCFLGKEPSVPRIQSTLALERIAELRAVLDKQETDKRRSCQRKINLLEQYIEALQKTDQDSSGYSPDYQMPADSVSPDEWAEFDNVYQIHCPKLFLDSAVRDIMMQYYYCSRARRGFEYHMATRAVKFIRDQAKAVTSSEPDHVPKGHHHTAQAAATAIRKIFAGEGVKSSERTSVQITRSTPSSRPLDPMGGWSDGVSLRKSHCCLLLKPQIVLRNREVEKDICVVTAVQAKLQSFAIMDDSNLDDPISGKVITYAVLSGMQSFAPTWASEIETLYVPLEVLIDLRCESEEFERVVPQTDATFHYDKFNRLRLRNNVTSVARRSTDTAATNHLQDQTDLIQVHIPNFTVSASDHHFQTISNIITKLLLFSDAAHKTRIDKLNTLMFSYDFFDDLPSSADVVCSLQQQIRTAIDIEHNARKSGRIGEDEVTLELMKLRAHLVSLVEELNLIFDAIKYAQDRSDDQTDRKSALLLNATSSEISWRMLDDQRDLLAKLVVQNIDYRWLSRQDSSTVNNLLVGNLQAFDGSRDALWAEIVAKHDEPHNHPLLKRGLFLTASWIVLPPVGGITIYETFEFNFHPLRLQVDARVGSRIMEYLWPARKDRHKAIEKEDESSQEGGYTLVPRVSLDSATPTTPSRQNTNLSSDAPSSGLAPPLRRLGASRSFTDLRSSLIESTPLLSPALHRTRSSEILRDERTSTRSPEVLQVGRSKSRVDAVDQPSPKIGDAAEMRTRSSQKTFVLVRIPRYMSSSFPGYDVLRFGFWSLYLVLNIMKEDSFVCQDARIRTRDLEFRNQTWSFEEFVNQFIPSDMGWKGWVKMAFHQPLVPVLPVARELISKTKWIASKSGTSLPGPDFSTKPAPIKAPPSNEGDGDHPDSQTLQPKTNHRWKKASRRAREEPVHITSGAFTQEPGVYEGHEEGGPTPPPQNRRRVLSLFSRSSSGSSKRARSLSRPANRRTNDAVKFEAMTGR
ncbi:hypothetical protein L218DRAFT_994841 [Marasmius fiardii PR-910]|nr:hypothetical protein L218DRAFT_994841 [Marasmius fiardii PR-910]